MSSSNAENLNFFTSEMTRRIYLQQFLRHLSHLMSIMSTKSSIILLWNLVVMDLLIWILFLIKNMLKIDADSSVLMIHQTFFVCLDTKLALSWVACVRGLILLFAIVIVLVLYKVRSGIFKIWIDILLVESSWLFLSDYLEIRFWREQKGLDLFWLEIETTYQAFISRDKAYVRLSILA